MTPDADDVAAGIYDRLEHETIQDGDLLVYHGVPDDDWTVQALAELRGRLMDDGVSVHIVTLDEDASLDSISEEDWREYAEKALEDL